MGTRDYNTYIKRFFFDLSFFLLITIIWMNIIFGIIIDTFAALRDEKNQKGIIISLYYIYKYVYT
jgi:hypothetical protein